MVLPTFTDLIKLRTSWKANSQLGGHDIFHSLQDWKFIHFNFKDQNEFLGCHAKYSLEIKCVGKNL
jgi:hypothetical protein